MKLIPVAVLIVFVVSCRTSSKPGLFARKTPHEEYGKQISDAGLHTTTIGRSWFAAAESSIASPVNIKHPYKESGFFGAGKPAATGLRFSAVRGEKLQVSIMRKPAAGFKLYIDFWQQDTATISPATRAGTLKLIASSDTTGVVIQHEVDRSGFYILRIQPELLQDCEYTVTIDAVASLAYPISAPGKNHTKSFWGVDRDAGARRHEGIDMFAARGTPVIAAADGRVTRVNENNLGGKVVWMRPNGKDYTLYYAHLDSQLVSDGQSVKTGDTLGLMGNTGNARTTPPHLHFGIYAMGGAIDPFPFVNPSFPEAEEIKAVTDALGKQRRLASNANLLTALPVKMAISVPVKKNELLYVTGATGDWYRVTLADGRSGFIPARFTEGLTPGKGLGVKTVEPLFNSADSSGLAKQLLAPGSKLQQLAESGEYLYVRTIDDVEGWVMKRRQ